MDDNRDNKVDEVIDELLDEFKEDENDKKPAKDGDIVLPVIPLRGLSMLPNMVLHFDVGREKSIKALDEAMINDQRIFLTAQKNESLEEPSLEDYYGVGVVAKIKQMLKLQGNTVRVLAEGVERAEITGEVSVSPFIKCTVKEIPETEPETLSMKASALKRNVIDLFEKYAELSRKVNGEVLGSVREIDGIARFSDILASHIDMKVEKRQEILETFDPYDRLLKLNDILANEIEIMKIEQDINAKVKDQVNQSQKEYYLREQMKAIQDELGIDEDIADEQSKWMEQLEALHLDEKIHQKIEREIKRMGTMQPMSAESSVSRTYIETLLALPWNTREQKKCLKRITTVSPRSRTGYSNISL